MHTGVQVSLHYLYVTAMVGADGEGFLQHSLMLKDPGTAFGCAVVRQRMRTQY